MSWPTMGKNDNDKKKTKTKTGKKSNSTVKNLEHYCISGRLSMGAGRRVSFPGPQRVVSYYYSYCCPPHPPSLANPPSLPLGMCPGIACPGPAARPARQPAVCVFQMFHARLNALLFDQLSTCPTVQPQDPLIVQLADWQTGRLAD